MKKVYNQPQTDVTLLETETLLVVMSPGGPGGGGGAEAPKRRGDVIP